MARSFLTAINLNKNELQNAAVQNLGTAPSAPVKGQLYYDSTGNVMYWWNGTTWVAAQGGAGVGYGSVPAETTFGITKNDGVATTVARSDHTHGSPTHGAADHTTIPISTFSAAIATVDMGNFTIGNLGAPANGLDAVTKNYVDNLIYGLAWKDSVLAATTANITLSGSPQTIDGVSAAVGQRVLVKNQTTTSQNGIYVVSAGAWTRSIDADAAGEIAGAAVFVEQGTTQGDTAWVMTTDLPITIGTTAITWVQFAGGGAVTAGAGMTQAGNTLNVIAADSSLVVGADNMYVNTSVIASVGSLAGYVPTTRQVIAGAGLTGGGALSADATLNVIAGDATLTVAADSIVRAPLTGDVTTVINAATIAPNVVDNTKLADMPGLRIKGNSGGTATDPQDLTIAQVKGMLNATGKSVVASAAGTTTVAAHGLGTTTSVVSVYRAVAPFDEVDCDIEHTDANNVTVRFATAVAANDYWITVIG